MYRCQRGSWHPCPPSKQPPGRTRRTGPLSIPSSMAASGVLSSSISFLNHLPSGRVEPLQHFRRDDLGDCLHLQIFGIEIRTQTLHDLQIVG